MYKTLTIYFILVDLHCSCFSYIQLIFWHHSFNIFPCLFHLSDEVIKCFQWSHSLSCDWLQATFEFAISQNREASSLALRRKSWQEIHENLWREGWCTQFYLFLLPDKEYTDISSQAEIPSKLFPVTCKKDGTINRNNTFAISLDILRWSHPL